MKLKPQPLVWLVGFCAVIFIAAGTIPVPVIKGQGGWGDTDCGSAWSEDAMRYGCADTHIGAIIIMVITAAVGITCLVLFAVIVLPGALHTDGHRGAVMPTSADSDGGSTRVQAPAGWYIDPSDSERLRWWTGDMFSETTKARQRES